VVPVRDDQSRDPDHDNETQLLRLRANLHDLGTGLDTLPMMVDRVRRLLEDRGNVQVFVARLEQERDLELAMGWEWYDRVVSELADHLRGILNTSLGASSLLCLEGVRTDEFIVFCADRHDAARLAGTLVEGISVEAADGVTAIHLPVRVGQGIVRLRAAQRVERAVYGGVLEARHDALRQGERLDAARRSDLRRILRDRGISTVFQPIVNLDERSILGCEALSRGPMGSYFEQAENLFGFAQRAAMLGEIEVLCLETALVSARPLRDSNVLFLNLSLEGLEFLEQTCGGLGRMVRQHGREPENVVLEITERTSAEDPALMVHRIAGLRREGFRIAIDDVGTGYSALHVLAELKPDFIKLDHLLVKDLDAEPIKQNLVSAVTRFAGESRARVIAEGVERRQEVEVLDDLGVDYIQGHYIAFPAPADQMAQPNWPDRG
jgi:EAL domain-containing protein (putative c-di-GMP-specific phosphodiesterase class I)